MICGIVLIASPCFNQAWPQVMSIARARNSAGGIIWHRHRKISGMPKRCARAIDMATLPSYSIRCGGDGSTMPRGQAGGEASATYGGSINILNSMARHQRSSQHHNGVYGAQHNNNGENKSRRHWRMAYNASCAIAAHITPACAAALRSRHGGHGGKNGGALKSSSCI